MIKNFTMSGIILFCSSFQLVYASDFGKFIESITGGVIKEIKIIEPVEKTLNLCGVEITVSAVLYPLCQTSVTSIPVSCTAGASTTAGSSCFVSISAAAATCGISLDILGKAANQCIDKAK